MNNDIIFKNLVLIGGGHAHVHVLKMLGMYPMAGVQVTVISRDVDTPYSGMLPGYVAGKYTRDECHVDLIKICNWAQIRLLHTEACGIDRDKKLIYCKDGRPPIRYDILSIDIGITPKGYSFMEGDECSRLNITPVKPIDGFARKWDVICSRVRQFAHEPTNKVFRLAIVGGGAGGCELAMSMHHRLNSILEDELKRLSGDGKTEFSEGRRVQIVLSNKSSSLLPTHNPSVRTIVQRLMTEKGIEIHFDSEAVGAEQLTVCSGDSTEGGSHYLVTRSATGEVQHISYHEVVWCTQGAAAGWLEETGLELSEGSFPGFICVKNSLESVNTPGVFACGDCAHLVENPRPKAGVFAVRAGPPLLVNLRRALLEEYPLTPWHPQDDFLGILYCGNDYAVASRGAYGAEGKHMWVLKDHIDRKWMKMYQELPPMEEEKSGTPSSRQNAKGVSGKNWTTDGIPDVARIMGGSSLDILAKRTMRCGGCGSKVGAQVLTRALKRIKQWIPTNSSIITGVGDDAALVRLPPVDPNMDPSDETYLVQTVDYFKSMVSDPYIFGQIAALHSLSDVHAMNGEAISTLAVCVVPYGPEQIVEDTLVQILGGACTALAADRDDEEAYREGGDMHYSGKKPGEGCALAGGHTSEGHELSLGFAVNGIARKSLVLHKGSPVCNPTAKTRDVIILTKPLGTGTLLAANMRGLAKCSWMVGCYKNMLLSNRKAAKIIAGLQKKYDGVGGVRVKCCCTDVTGFGLLGHLIEMLQYDDNREENPESTPLPAAQLHMSKVPMLLGATECIQQGVFSTLHPQNIRCKRAIEQSYDSKYSSISKTPEFPLLFDPQTSGGLLTTVPECYAVEVIDALKAATYVDSSIIGVIVPRKEKEICVYLEE